VTQPHPGFGADLGEFLILAFLGMAAADKIPAVTRVSTAARNTFFTDFLLNTKSLFFF